MEAQSPIDAETQAVQALPPRPFQFNLRHLLLGVLGISVILAIGVPYFRMELRQAEELRCGNNLKQIAVGLHTYHDVWKCFPPVFTTDGNGKPMHSWRVMIVPCMEGTAWFDRYDMNEPWNGPNNRKLGQHGSPPYWRCPTDRRTGREMTNYVAVYGPGTAWDINKATRFNEIGDGMSRTILIVEIRNSDIHWMEPRDIHINDLKLKFNATDGPSLGSYHIEGALVAMADGSVRLLSPDEIAEHLQAMLTIAGGERTPQPTSED